MTDKSKLDSPYWLEMVDYLIKLAESNLNRSDVTRALINKEVKIGRSYQDYTRTLDELIDDGVIYIDDSVLYLGSISNSLWINEALNNGDEEVWKLAAKIEPNNTWQSKYDDTELKEIGDKGEEAVIQNLKQAIDVRYQERIKHVSKVDDSLGYDILSPSTLDHEKYVLLEVKTTVQPYEDFIFYLSRNEYNVGLKNKNWYLILVRIKNNDPKLVGYLNIYQIDQWFPKEIDKNVSWQSLKIAIPSTIIQEGIP